MTHITVQSFGAIVLANIDIKKYNVFIGHTSSGKSIIAKLIAIFNHASFWAIKEGDSNSFTDLLSKYNINFEFNDLTNIVYKNGEFHWEIAKNKFHTNYKDSDLMSMANSSESRDFVLGFIEKKKEITEYATLINAVKGLIGDGKSEHPLVHKIKPLLLSVIYDNCPPVYIPAERLLISTFTNSIFSLLQAGANIPECIKDFGSFYERARMKYKNIDIEILNIKVSFSNSGDTVLLKSDNSEVKMSQTSSGIQSIIPLWAVFNQFVESKDKQILVVEEPELNLFPSAQYSLIDWIMKGMKNSNGSIVITTHSPYVLSAMDNLILANEVLKKVSKNNRLAVQRKIKKLIPSMALINFDDVSSYFFGSDGNVMDIRDLELKTLGAEYIDEASNKSSLIFNELCNIERDEL